MLIEDVKNLSPLDRFVYWIRERHQIHLRRKAGQPKPWSDDEVMQSVFFTNPYRENDKTTVWFRENIRDPLKDDPIVLFATVCFRWFNLISTGRLLMSGGKFGLLRNWDEKRAVSLLTDAWGDGKNPVFTGAYMIKAGNGPRGCKIPNVCAAISNVWKERGRLVEVCSTTKRLECLCKELSKFPHLGGFMSYEVACDLRYTALLDDAVDIMTWSNLGPGAARGIQRLNGQKIEVPKSGMKDARPKPPADWLAQFQTLQRVVSERLPKMPKFELREIEHSLCEYDKYERILFSEGQSKRRFQGA